MYISEVHTMQNNQKRLFRIAFGGLVLINLLLFLIFYIPNYILEASSIAWDYFNHFLTRLFEFILPAISAVLLFVGAKNGSTRQALISAIWLSLPRFIYLFPYYYLYETAYGSDWIESITISFLINILVIALYWAHLVALYLIMLCSARSMIKRTIITEYPKAYAEKIPKDALPEFNKRIYSELSREMKRDGIFNLDLTVSFAIMLGCIAEFVYRLALECVDAISFLIEYAGTYRTDEIIYMIFSFAFILLEALIAYVLCCLVKRIAVKQLYEKDAEESAKL